MLKVYPMRALAYSKTGMYDKAVEDMDYYLSYVKDDADAWYRYGTINSNEGKYFKALECYNKCLSLDQKDARYFLARGVTYMNTRTYNYARNDLSMALDLDPQNAEAYYQKAHACVKLGLNEEACFCFQQAYRYGKYEAGEYSEKYCTK
jgi:tetratricopeptide (TPR) repeat protein